MALSELLLASFLIEIFVVSTGTASSCYPQGPCDDGYMDQTDGNYKNWACGSGCVGGQYYTDGTCGCACVVDAPCESTTDSPIIESPDASTDTISPTTSNKTHEIYIASEDYNFQFGFILCQTTHCIITCNASNVCYGMHVDASSSSTLYIECSQYQSCESANIKAYNITRVDLSCNYSASSSSDGSCTQLSLTVSSPPELSSTVTVKSTGSNAMYSTLITAEDSFIGALYIQCSGESSCESQSVDIRKMNGGIEVICDGSNSCKNQEILAGELQGDSSFMEYTCIGESACLDAVVDVNQTDNVRVWCREGSSACALILNASYSQSVHVSCDYASSCSNGIYRVDNVPVAVFNSSGSDAMSNVDIYATTSGGNVSIFCDASYSCQGSKVWLGTMTGILEIKCGALAACQEMNVYGATSNGQVKIKAPNQESFANGHVYCPSDTLCSIECIGSMACRDTQIYLSDDDYDHLQLDCTSYSNTCTDISLQCLDTGFSTQMSFDSDSLSWSCSTFGCCPLYDGTITCPAGKDCEIECTEHGTTCRNYYINATLASSLSFQCSSDCTGAHIQCPMTDSATCSIVGVAASNSSLQYVSIELSDNAALSRLELKCPSDYACQYASIMAPSTSIIDIISIHCLGASSCSDSSFTIASDITLHFNITCSSTGCKSMEMHILSDHIDHFQWHCTDSSSCNAASLIMSNTTSMHWMYILCGGDASCENAHVHGPHIVSGGSAIIDCVASNGCSEAMMEIHVESETNVTIHCANPDVTTWTGSAACKESQFYIRGISEPEMTGFWIECNQFDCYALQLVADDLNNVQIDCTATYSCSTASLDASTSDQVFLSCDGVQSCRDSTVYCTYQDISSCHIDCSEDSQSCYALDISVPGTYSYGYLDLDCPSETIYPDSYSCVGVTTVCSSGSKSDAVFTYSSTTHQYECSSSDTTSCCPFYDGEVVSCDDEGTRNCSMDCTSSSTCDNALIDGMNADYLSIHCGGSYQCTNSIIHCPSGGCHLTCDGAYSCNALQVAYIGEVDDFATIKVTCNEAYSCYQLSYDAGFANRVEIVAIGGYAMYSATVYAEDAASVTVRCSSDDTSYACHGNWYIPQETTFYCYGKGCYSLGSLQLNDQSADSVEMKIVSCNQCSSVSECVNSLYMYCDSSYYGYGRLSYGSCSVDQCGCSAFMEQIDFSTTHFNEYCYSQFDACDSGGDCDLSCDDSYECLNAFVDGSSSSSLHVECSHYQSCYQAVIYCPIGHCLIQCTDSYSCQGMVVMYDGVRGDGGNVQISCSDYYACYDVEVHANQADYVSLTCTSDEDSQQFVCYEVQLNASNAGVVEVTGNYRLGLYSSMLHVENAGSVTLNARGYHGLNGNTVYALNAGSVSMTCVDDETDSTLHGACYSNTMYLPTNTSIQCYGNGCDDMNIYSKDGVANFSVWVNSCGDCQSLDDCLGSIAFSCGQMITEGEDQSFCGSTLCDYYTSSCGSNECGCDSLLHKVMYLEDAGDEMCVDQSSVSWEDVIPTLVIVVGVCFVVCFVCCRICKCCCRSNTNRPSRKYSNPQQTFDHQQRNTPEPLSVQKVMYVAQPMPGYGVTSVTANLNVGGNMYLTPRGPGVEMSSTHQPVASLSASAPEFGNVDEAEPLPSYESATGGDEATPSAYHDAMTLRNEGGEGNVTNC